MKTTSDFVILLMFFNFFAGLPLVKAQTGKAFRKVTIEVLDSYSNSFKPLFSKELAALQINLLKITTEKEEETKIVKGVMMEVASSAVSETISSTGLALTSNFNLVLGGSSTRVIKTNKGQYFLGLEEMNNLISFLNETLKIQVQLPQPPNDIAWRLEFDDGLIFGFFYDKTSVERWYYFIQVDEAKFQIGFTAGKDMIKKLASFRKQLE